MAPLARYGFRPQDAFCGGLLSAYAMTWAGARTQGTRQAASRGRPTGRRIQPRRELAGVRPARWAKRSGSGAEGWAGAAMDSRMASTLADETNQSRLPNCRPFSLPASIQRKTVGRDLPRIRAASCTGISAPARGPGGAPGALSQAVRMESRWAGESPLSASRMAATAARVWGAICEAGFFFMALLSPKGKGDSSRKMLYFPYVNYAT